jgi:hypothetical protein
LDEYKMARYKFPAPTPPSASAGNASAPSVAPYLTVLEEKFPRILDSITTMWGSQELNAFFRKLTIDDRGGRQGFPPDAWEEIQTMWLLHLVIVPENTHF